MGGFASAFIAVFFFGSAVVFFTAAAAAAAAAAAVAVELVAAFTFALAIYYSLIDKLLAASNAPIKTLTLSRGYITWLEALGGTKY